MKMLYILNVANKINNFCMSSLLAAKEMDIEFHIAGNWGYLSDNERRADEKKYNIHIYQIDFYRFPLDIHNYKAYKQLNSLLNKEKYDVIHCNTPIGGVLGRICGKKAGIPKIIYQVHGFHFYKGAPILNWIIYYPIEKWLACCTDALITINQEDYELAKNKFHLKNNGQVYYIPGVGIDLSQFTQTTYMELRASIGVEKDDVMVISAGDLIERKNYKLGIESIAKTNLENIKYCICGNGPQFDELKDYAKLLGVAKQIIFLGFRSDIKELLQVADIFLITTKQEGLPRSMMEAMAVGLPCVASKVRGNKDLLEDGVGGYLCDVDSSAEFAEAIRKLACDSELRRKFGEDNLKYILKFDISPIANQMRDIYVRECQTFENEWGGVNSYEFSKFYPVRVRKRLELGLSLDDVVLISAGRLDANKNNETTIRAVAKVSNVKLLLCGEGELRKSLENLAKSLGVKDRVFFLGNRTDILELYQAADIFVMMSFREGLSRSIMEAMASGLPCVVSKIRGNVDLIEEKKGGYLCDTNDSSSLADNIDLLSKDIVLREQFRDVNLERIKAFNIDTVINRMKGIYNSNALCKIKPYFKE